LLRTLLAANGRHEEIISRTRGAETSAPDRRRVKSKRLETLLGQQLGMAVPVVLLALVNTFGSGRGLHGAALWRG